MRGGAIPLLAWAGLLLVLFIGNVLWNGKAVSAAAAGFGCLAILVAALLVTLRSGREALRRGAPEPHEDPVALARASSGAALAGLSLACLMFGFVFGTFLVYFGAGMLLISVGRLVQERRAQALSREVLKRELGRGR